MTGLATGIISAGFWGYPKWIEKNHSDNFESESQMRLEKAIESCKNLKEELDSYSSESVQHAVNALFDLQNSIHYVCRDEISPEWCEKFKKEKNCLDSELNKFAKNQKSIYVSGNRNAKQPYVTRNPDTDNYTLNYSK